MTALETLIDDNVALLRQGLTMLEGLDDEAYARAHPSVGLSGVGSHLRHLVDFYERLFAGVEAGRVDYDARARDPRLEREVDYTSARLRRLITELEELPARAVAPALEVKSDSEGASPATAPWTASSLERELQAVLSHTVHHYALMAVALRLSGHEPDESFGVAPSTLRYWKEQRACAR
jgi:uncharacterized damage-inducible protein DinB